MELLIAAALGGVLLTFVLFKLIWRIVSSAVDNGVDWLIHSFGNESARAEVEKRWSQREE